MVRVAPAGSEPKASRLMTAPGAFSATTMSVRPIVVPGVDYTDQADAAFRRYAAAGMHVVRSTDPIEAWPGVRDCGA